jgi:SagB-type dehydrogenase family enzyme
MDELASRTIQYHEKTKHHFHRNANGPGYMDWQNQPDPFRKYEGARRYYLPPIIKDKTPAYHSLFSNEILEVKPLSVENISDLFEMSMGITAWKQAGDSRWPLRANPSSGNLHPTEAYLVIIGLEDLNRLPGVYHYLPKEHAIELRTQFYNETWNDLTKKFPLGTFLIGLSSIHWREAWKYGERAFRYCQHDIGHALAAVRIAAAALGWKAVHLDGMSDADISQLLGLDRVDDYKESEREHPDLILALFPDDRDSQIIPLALEGEPIKLISAGEWEGKANRLSADRVEWEIIDTVAKSSLKDKRENEVTITLYRKGGVNFEPVLNSSKRKKISSRQIIRQRRSAVSFDGFSSMSKEEFYCVLAHTIVNKGIPSIPWDALHWKPSVHLFLFVHRVKGIESGLYFLVRNSVKLEEFKTKFKPDFEWSKPSSCPEELHLFLLKKGDFKRHAAQVSCGQDIAGDSAFSLGMIAEIQSSIEMDGASQYRRLFWESGMIGQNLYLAAEYIGLRGTGIGCYFDDPVRELLGVKDTSLESFYHFTIGGPVEDSRLQTHAPYLWSEEISPGKFKWNDQKVEQDVSNQEKTDNSNLLQFNDKWVSKIGAGLRGMSRYRNSNLKALGAILKSPINVFETSPDETDGEDEWLLGEALSMLSAMEPFDRKKLFVITRGGWVRGKNLRMIEALIKRGNLERKIHQLDTEIQLCVSQEYLKDQIERSIYRMGINSLDLFLLRVPIFFEGDIFDEICDALKFLEEQYNAGKINSYGLSLFELKNKVASFSDFPLEKLKNKLKGFRALEVTGNFVNKQAFMSEQGKESIIKRAKKLGLKVIVGNPFKAQIENKPVWLADYFVNSSWEEAAKELLNKAKNLELEIQKTPLADNRTLEEAMRDARIRSPFNFSQMLLACLEKKEPSSDDYSRLEEAANQSISMSKTVRDQLIKAKLLSKLEFEESLSDIESLFDNVLFGLRCFIRFQINCEIKEIRETHFGDKPEKLQVLGINWLFEQGVDIVLNKISHPEYIDDILSILGKTGRFNKIT